MRLLMIRLERHRQGPRVYVLGRRVHEWHLGLVLLLSLGATWLAHLWGDSNAGGLAVVAGAWLVAKDWRDILPSQRDRASWSLGFHRPAPPLRALTRANGAPTAAATAAFVVGLVNLLSALTPNIAWRGQLLLHLEPVQAVPVFHTLAVPASVALIVCAWHLKRRRRRALVLAVALMAALGVLSLLKGLDFEEAALSWAVAAALWWARSAFSVRHEQLRVGRRWLVGVVAAVVLGAVVAFTVTAPLVGLLEWTKGSVGSEDELSWLPLVLEVLGLLAVVGGAAFVFRPLRPPRSLPGRDERRAAHELVREHGDDTLAFFKLRADVHYLFSPDRRAFLAYRVENGVLLVSGDPVGPPGSVPGLVRETCAFADARGLRIGALGASEELLAVWAQAGLRSLYIGDEAVVETARFSLEGRSIRKVRQSCSRLEKAGYAASVVRVADLDAATLEGLHDVSARWLAGGCERGFSMAMDGIAGDHRDDGAVVVARDGTGAARAFLHLVPSYGRAAMSLSAMRRDPETPNGLMEYLIVTAIELLRERGVEELSLNFAAFGRILSRPDGRLERLLGRLVSFVNPFFQIESLLRFSAKFEPRWEPRYLAYDGGVLGLPRVGLAALRVEGQLPRLRS